MTSVPGNQRLWQGTWDASALAEGELTLDVQAATGSGARMDSIVTYVTIVHDGDVNRNKVIDLADALMDLQIVVGLLAADDTTSKIGDVFPLGNDGRPLGDGSIDVRDTIMILRRVVGLTTW